MDEIYKKYKELKTKISKKNLDREKFKKAYENIKNHAMNGNKLSKNKAENYLYIVYGISKNTAKSIIEGKNIAYKTKIKGDKVIEERL